MKTICLCALNEYLLTVVIFTQFKLRDDAHTLAGDRIGWTYEGEFGVISFDYVQGHKTYYAEVSTVGLPDVGSTVVFQSIPLPAVFSIAVEMDLS